MISVLSSISQGFGRFALSSQYLHLKEYFEDAKIIALFKEYLMLQVKLP